MAVELGLKLDLSAWKKGVRDAGTLVENTLNARALSPFDRAVKRSADSLKKKLEDAGKEWTKRFDVTNLAAVRGAFGAVAAGVAVMTAAVAAAAAAFTRLWDVGMRAVEAFNAYEDSVTSLRAALGTIAEGPHIDKALAGVEELGSRLRLAMGLNAAETNRAFASFVTRGFDLAQARQLTILAANYSKQAGKPLEEVAKKIADAANGSVDAIKDLGVEVAKVEGFTASAEAAVLKLKESYGSIGADLANPSERLAAAWDHLAVVFGDRLAPVMNPIVQRMSELVVGLTETEEGRAAMERLVGQIERALNAMMRLLEATDNVVASLASVQNVMLGPSRRIVETLAAPGKAALGLLSDTPSGSPNAFRPPRRNRFSFLDSLKDFVGFGADLNAEANEALRRETAAAAGQTFSGRVAKEKDAEAERKRADAESKSIRARAGVQPGSRVTVTISNPTGGDQFGRM